jgi:phosphatidylglycerol---prolipoprotein diacylglyceryl transferase
MHPILFHIGSFPVYSYGVMLLAALIAGVFVAGWEFERLQERPGSALYPLVAIVAITGLVGSRVFYVVGHWNEFSGNWSQIFDLNTAGLVFYGALVFAFPLGILAAKRLGLPAGPVVGAVGLALPLALGIARIGCFLNGCCGGKPSGLPWAVTFPGSTTRVHPTQIYEAILDIAFFVILLLLVSRFRDGWDLFLCSVAGYAAIRFFVEFFRFHTNPNSGLFFQLMSAAIFAAAVAALFIRRRVLGRPILGSGRGEEPGAIS